MLTRQQRRRESREALARWPQAERLRAELETRKALATHQHRLPKKGAPAADTSPAPRRVVNCGRLCTPKSKRSERIHCKLDRRFLRGVARRFNSKLGRQLAELWANRA